MFQPPSFQPWGSLHNSPTSGAPTLSGPARSSPPLLSNSTPRRSPIAIPTPMLPASSPIPSPRTYNTWYQEGAQRGFDMTRFHTPTQTYPDIYAQRLQTR